MRKTAEQWLEQSDLPTELGRVFTPDKHADCTHEWRYGHNIIDRYFAKCAKCEWCVKAKRNANGSLEPVLVRDPITIDWNTAKYWQGKCDERKFLMAAREVFKVLYPDAMAIMRQVHRWLAGLHKPEDAKYVLVIAAMVACAMAAERIER